MSAVGQYILTVVAAAILVSIVMCFIGNRSHTAPYIKLVGGLFLTVTVFSPLLGVDSEDITKYFSSINADADSIVMQSQQDLHQQKAAIIKAETETYILEKAKSFGSNISVEIGINDVSGLVPTEVQISGAISPYVKRQLSKMISSDLGIPEEHQKWH